MVKKKKKKSKALTKKKLKRSIVNIFTGNSTQTLNYKQIAKTFGLKTSAEKTLVNTLLYELTSEAVLEEIYTGKFRLLSTGQYPEGRITIKANGSAFVVVEDSDEEIFIKFNKLNKALNGDKVRLHLFAKRHNHQAEGEVIEIVERTSNQFVGTIDLQASFAFLIADNKNMPYDIFIPLAKLGKAKNGYKAVATIESWPENTKNPVGKITEVLGKPGDNNTEMHAILAEYELPYKFKSSVLAAADKISETITEEEIAKRRDFRNVTTFTIDPRDAKDFDDALSVKEIDKGVWEVGVHIADVSHYVQPDSVLDKEAYNRATSVYLVDRVVPMLPEKLSNKVCSLRPNEEKLCYSTVFILTDIAEIKDIWFGRTVINSNRRFTYEQAQDIIEGAEDELSNEVHTLNSLAEILREKRYNEGAIAFERTETRFNIDEDGKPISVYFKEAKAANKLIEEFMLLANKEVARFIGDVPKEKKAKNFVYRIHDKPDQQKLHAFSNFIKRFGYKVNPNDKKVSQSINSLLANVNGKPEEDIISNLAIRSMAKAEYNPKNIGHYGLAFDYYTHFTSPIRRYPDVMVHRLLDNYLQGGKSARIDVLERKCQHSSDMERRAAMAERSSIRYKQVEFMADKLGEVYEAVISGVTEWGIYTEIVENKIEGLVALRDLDDDYYVFDEKNFRIIGRDTKKTYSLGDKVQIQIARANLERKQLDFVLYKEKKSRRSR